MKRILISLGVVVALLVLAVAWFFHSCQKSMQGHGDYHQCQMNREVLDMGRYWYALDNGLTNAPALAKDALAVYVQDEKAFTCPGGGTYSIRPTNQHVVCSIPEHMLDTCKGNHSPPDEPRHWLQDFPLNYRKSEQWWQSMVATEDGTILRMSGATIHFKGLHEWGGGWGTMEVAGTGTSQGSSSSGDRVVSTSYANGVYRMNFAGHVVQVTDGGGTLRINEKTFDLSATRPWIIVETNGQARVEEAEKRPNQVPEDTARKLADPQH